MNTAEREEIIALADEIESLPKLTLRGLMCIPKSSETYNEQLQAFAPLAELFNQLKSRYSSFDTLSMGMIFESYV